MAFSVPQWWPLTRDPLPSLLSYYGLAKMSLFYAELNNAQIKVGKKSLKNTKATMTKTPGISNTSTKQSVRT